jgi:micrococcal nuclease
VRVYASVTVALAVAVGLLAGAGCGRLPGGSGAGAANTAAADGAATVVRTIDGDTLVAEIGSTEEHIRLIGIDTPETHKPDSPVECYGQEAADHLAELLPSGTAISLVRDVEARDRYGRLLAYVYRAADDLFVNLDLAASGFAAQLTIPPDVAHADEFGRAVAAAREAGLGLWGMCGGPDTPVDG